MSIEIHDPDLIQLLLRLNYENWFEVLYPIADRFREIGEAGLADRVEDFILERKRPYRSSNQVFWWLYSDPKYQNEFDSEHRLPALTVEAVDRANIRDGIREPRSARCQLIGYLSVPEHLRIPRQTKG